MNQVFFLLCYIHLICFQIIKKKVDNFKPGQMIPSCQLNATIVSVQTSKVPSLEYCVKLLGAKKPYDMFTIIPSSTATISRGNKGTSTSDVSTFLGQTLTTLQ